MTDERDKPSRSQESVARTTARDVPFTRGDSEAEPAPRGQRPAQLPRDPTYEQELALVELAVLRNPERRDDPSTKQGGRRALASVPPDSVTPESPGARANQEALLARSPNPPSSGGRAVASGTLLSVGAVDPRGKTERTLETPRMFFSQAEQAEAYFKPGAIPAVTVHQTLETETVKLSDSIDPRRAKTIPRLDRMALARLAELENVPESAAPVAMSQPASSLDLASSDASMRWNQHEYDADPSSFAANGDGQIHASLSPFREQAESYDYDGTPTRAEPLAARRRSDEPPPQPSAPDPGAIPTQRDLPMHRIEASMPPPPPSVDALAAPPLSAPSAALESGIPASEGPSPTTASIAADEPERRAAWINYAAFAIALLLAVVLGLWLTSGSSAPLPESIPAEREQKPPPRIEAPPPVNEKAPLPPVADTADTAPKKPVPVEASRAKAPVTRAPAAEPAPLTKPPAPASASRKPSTPKTTREPIF